MKRLLTTFFVLSFLLISMHNVLSFQKYRIIFYHVKAGQGVTQEEISELKSAIRGAIINHKKLDLVPDDNIEAVFKRNGISENGCTATACAIKIGRDSNINAKFALYAEIYKTEEGYSITASVVDVEKEIIIWQPVRRRRVLSSGDFSRAASGIVNEFGKTIQVNATISTVLPQRNQVIINVGGDLGMNKGERYRVEEIQQFSEDPSDIEVNDLGIVEIIDVKPIFSLAKVVNGQENISDFEGATLQKMAGIVDDVLPIIKHAPIKTCSQLSDMTIECELSDNIGIQNGFVYFSISNPDGKYEKIECQQDTDRRNIYTATIPAKHFENAERLYYYIEAYDQTGNKRVKKDEMGDPFMVSIISIDKTPPNIDYEPPKENIKSNSFIITANVKDNIGIKKVWLSYKFDKNDSYGTRLMEIFSQETSTYGVELDLSSIKSDRIYYYIEAYDLSNNMTRFPVGNEPMMQILKSKDITPPNILYKKFSRIDEKSGEIIANITDDNSGIKEVKIKYGCDEKSLKKSVKMLPVDINSIQFHAIINLTQIDCDKLAYIIEAKDGSKNVAKTPPSIERIRKITTKNETEFDTTPPRIAYFISPIAYKTKHYSPGKKIIWIFQLAGVQDNSGIDNVKLFFRDIGEHTFREFALSQWGKIWGEFIVVSDKGKEFYITAADVNNNIAYWASPKAPARIEKFILLEKMPRGAINIRNNSW